MMQTKVLVLIGLLLLSRSAATEVGIGRILPTITELGSGWTSNRIVLLVDPLSSPSEVADARDAPEPEAMLRSTRESMRRSHRTGQAFIRYHLGNQQFGVFINRFDSKSAAEANWTKSVEEEATAATSVPRQIGERVRSGNRNGMHNHLTFLRGQYFVTVECGLASGWKDIEHLARAIDEKLVKEMDREEK
jgi:hypothetical protein